MLEHILPCGQTSVSYLAFQFQINHIFPERNYIRILQIPKINEWNRIRKMKKYLSKVVVFERIRVKIKLTSKNAGLNIKRTKIQLKIMAIIDFALVQWSCKNFGWKTDNARLKAINARAIQSALENKNANTIEATHHPSPNVHSYPI